MLRSKFVKFLMAILKRLVDSSPHFISLFSFMKDNSSVLFCLKQYILCPKGGIKVKIFETFESSGQNLSNCLCQSWNDKSIPFEILYSSSVLWKVTPLYFFSSDNIYFAQKEFIKVEIIETFECSGQNLSNSLCQF